MLGEHPHPSGAAMRGKAGSNLHSSLVSNIQQHCIVMALWEHSCWQRCCALEGLTAGEEVEHKIPAVAASAMHVLILHSPGAGWPAPFQACSILSHLGRLPLRSFWLHLVLYQLPLSCCIGSASPGMLPVTGWTGLMAKAALLDHCKLFSSCQGCLTTLCDQQVASSKGHRPCSHK